jgi:predicted RNase H-like HicB family nuclease
MKKIVLTGEIWKEGNMYTSYCHELDVVSCGDTVEKARENLKDAIEIFLEETAKKGILKELLEEAGFSLDVENGGDQLISSYEFQSFERLEIPFKVLDYAKNHSH